MAALQAAVEGAGEEVSLRGAFRKGGEHRNGLNCTLEETCTMTDCVEVVVSAQ